MLIKCEQYKQIFHSCFRHWSVRCPHDKVSCPGCVLSGSYYKGIGLCGVNMTTWNRIHDAWMRNQFGIVWQTQKPGHHAHLTMKFSLFQTIVEIRVAPLI